MPSYLVTGASRGLGYAMFKVLAAEPSNIVIGLVRDKKATEDRLAADGVTNAHILASDITDEQGLKLAAEAAGKILGDSGLDVIINNAAYVSDVTALKSLQDFEHDTQPVVDDTQKSFDINVFGVLKTVFAFLPLIKAGGLKKVVAISSGMADIDLINEIKLVNAVPYAVSKAALNTLFAKLNAAYADEGILFMSLCPGLVATAEDEKTYSEDDLNRLQQINSKFMEYAPGFTAQEPTAGARNVLAAISRSSLPGGSGGSFLSHNGTKRWM